MNTISKIDYEKQAFCKYGVWVYVLKWEQLPEIAGILDYVNREVTIEINGNSHSVTIVDRPLSFKN